MSDNQIALCLRASMARHDASRVCQGRDRGLTGILQFDDVRITPCPSVHGRTFHLRVTSMMQHGGMTARDNDPDTQVPRPLRRWSGLDEDERLALREAFGHYQDTLPVTCDMDEKIARFRRWLTNRGVDYDETP
jgi:hypothetical protein